MANGQWLIAKKDYGISANNRQGDAPAWVGLC